MKAIAKGEFESGQGRSAAFALSMLSIGVGLCLSDCTATVPMVSAGLFLTLSFPPIQHHAAQTGETCSRWRATMQWLGCGITAAYLLSVVLMASVGQHSFLM
jgi:hypothetical protein